MGEALKVWIDVGRCSDLGGGDFFFKNNKNVISLRNNAYMQYCNEVHYVNSQWVKLGGESSPLPPPLPTPMGVDRRSNIWNQA